MLVHLSPDDAELVRDVCRAALYTDTKLVETLGTQIPPPRHHIQTELFSSLTAAATPFHCLARLFFLGIPIAHDEARDLLPSRFVETCLECGLLESDQSFLRPLALLVPCDEWFLAADLHQPGVQADDRYVPTLSQPALHLLSFAIQRPVGATLDLCGGFGLHGIAASRFSHTVVCSDRNARAKAFAEFNATLNGCQNLEVVTGDLFSAVEGRKFDLILCNPPFVISPVAAPTFRSSQLDLDGFLKEMLAQAPHYLEEAGFFETICEWVEIRGQDWRDRLGPWLHHNGCDAWILHANRQLPESYAKGRLRETTANPEELATGLVQWQRYFEDQQVEAIHGGLIFLRRRPGPNWCDITQLTKPVVKRVGDAVLRAFSNRDLLHADDAEQALLSSRPYLTPGLRQEETSHWEDNAWKLDSITLHLEDGLPVTIGVDSQVRDLICRFDGTQTVEFVLRGFAEHWGIAYDEAKPQFLEMVRRLIENDCLALGK